MFIGVFLLVLVKLALALFGLSVVLAYDFVDPFDLSFDCGIEVVFDVVLTSFLEALAFEL